MASEATETEETLAENMDFEGGEDGGEVMVEVVGSDVLVDGAGGHGEEGGGVLVKEGFEREVESVDGDGGVTVGSVWREVGDLGGRVLDSKAENQDEGFEETAVSLDGQTGVDSMEEVLMMRVDGEVSLERGEPMVGGDCDDATEDKDSGVETGVGGPLAISRSTCEETQVVDAERVVVTVGGEILESGLVEECVERGMEHVEGGVGALESELLSQSGSFLDDGIWNPGIEAESSSRQTADVAEGVSVTANDEALNHKDEVPSSGAVEGSLQSSAAETVSADREKDGAITNKIESLNERVEVAFGGEVSVMNNEESLHPAGNSCCPVETQQMMVDTAGESDESKGHLHADFISSCGPTMPVAVSEGTEVGDTPKSVVLGEIGADAGDVVCADSGSSPVAAECSVANESKISVSATVIQAGGVSEPLTTENGISGASVENIDFVEDHDLKVKDVSGESEREAAVCTESHSSYEQIQVINGNKVSVMEGNISNSKVEIPITDDTERTVACSEDDQNVECETTCGIAGIDGHVSADPGSSTNEQAFDSERAEVGMMDIEDVTNIEGEVTRVDDLDGSCSGKDQDLKVKKVDESSENDVVHRDLESCDKQTHTDDKNAIATTAKEVTKLEGEVVIKDGERLPNSKIEVLDGDTCIQKDEESNTMTVGGSLGDDGETLGKNTVEDPSVGIDSPQIGDDGASIPTLSDSLEEDTPLQDENQETEAQLAHIGTHEEEGDQSKTITTVDEESAQVDCAVTLPNAVTEGTAAFRAALDDASAHNVAYPASSSVTDHTGLLLDEHQNVLLPEESQFIGDDTQAVGGNVGFGFSECLDEGATGDLYLVDSSLGQDVEIQDQCTADAEQLYQYGGQEVEMGEHSQSFEDKSSKQTTLKSGSFAKGDQAKYLLVPENEDEFSLSDLVWGKVRSHPWWPGQIFDSADASEEAMKYYKKDCFLVAYFGDRTFAWNEASLLKPFWSNFSQIEKQSNSGAFQSAVSCALEEVSRRVELGLACSCIPKDVYDGIESQFFENTGIREESSRRYGVVKSTGASSFGPDKLLKYVRALAQAPSAGADRLELVVAKAQLLAFNRLKGYCSLPKFQFRGSLLENNAENPELGEAVDHMVNDEQLPSFKGRVKTDNTSSHKRKHNLRDIAYPSKKERSLSESMGDMASSPDGEDELDWKASSKSVSSPSGKKRKSVDFLPDGSDVQDKRISIYAAKVSTTAPPIPKPSFKVGECISRVASQLTGSPSILKSNSEKLQKVDGSSEVAGGFDVSLRAPDSSQKGRISVPMECSSLEEMLSQLHLTARDPRKGYSLMTTIISFFSGFRNSISLGRLSGKQNSFTGRVGGGRKKKAPHGIGLSEEFEFDDVNDSYWTDMSIQNNSEEQPSSNSKNREGEYQLVAFDPDKTHKSSRRSYSRKRFSTGNHEMAIEDSDGYVDKMKQDMSPAELLLHFSEGDRIPSGVNLNKIFRRFGPLKDSETEVDVETSRARVVFKRGSDAQVAFSSAGKFNIFEPMTVNYQLNYTPSKLNYTPSISFDTFSLATSQGLEDAA